MFDASATSEKPVMAPAAIGLTPMSPVMTLPGTVEMPDFERIAKVPATPSGMSEVSAAEAAWRRRSARSLERSRPRALVLGLGLCS